MQENMVNYNKLSIVPKNALKTIQAGRLKGFSDINPQWRYETMTAVYGAVGVGWYFDVVKQETIEANSEIGFFVDINLFVKVDGEWSKPIFGSGGSMLLANERNGLHYSDEAKKMAITDALGTAMKLLGVGAPVYRGTSDSKYKEQAEQRPSPSRARTPEPEDTTTENTATHDADPTNKQKVFLKSIMNNALIEDDEAAKIAKWLEKDRTKDEYSTVIDRYKKIIDERIAAEETPY
jgi:hypothetical protein